MDKKLITQDFINQLDQDLQDYGIDERIQLTDWFMANQLSKEKKTVALIETWENSPSAKQRRIFLYYQARLRWMGNTNHSNTGELLTSIETNIADKQPEVQWAMNFTAGQIRKWQAKYRARWIAIEEETGLYKDEVVPKKF